jgi:predicted Zn-dependent protease
MNKPLLFISLVFVLAACSKQDTSYVNNPDAPDYLHNRAVGASANELLAGTKYTSLVIEVQFMTGFAPDAAALNHLQATLAGIVNKPAGISIVTKEISASNQVALSVNDIVSIERNNRTKFTTGDQLAVYILYTNGNYTNENVLGIAYKNTSAVLFGKKINDNSGGLGQASRTKLVATVAEHELGHLLGLVDLGSPMQTGHKDAANGNHCSNTNCMMYYASETSDVLGFLVTGNIPAFDANCRADMRANGGQ